MNSLENHKQFMNYFKNLTSFDRKQFDRYVSLAEEYSSEFGLDGNDLEVITTVSFKQNLASQRIVNLLNVLIPKTTVPESVVRTVLKWILYNYNQQYPKMAMKHVLLWLTGLIEHELTNVEVINGYYDIFFYLLRLDQIEAARLIYLLTKPIDVNRWLVKQVLRYHKVNNHAKYTGVLLYLFKTYRPDCVPENVPAYAVQAVFKKIPIKLSTGFERAKERCIVSNTIPHDINSIKWGTASVRNTRSRAITLVPRLPPIKNINIKTSDYKSLITVTNNKELQKYMLEQNEITCTLSLLNNSAGYHVLKFSDIGVQSRFSFVLYHVLYDAFIQNNPNVSEDEKNYLLRCLALFQVNIQQNVPVTSKFISDYIITWDGYDFSDNLLLLLQFIHFKSYDDLHNNLLKHLKMIFISGTLKTKCRIIKLLGDMAVNIIWDYVYYQKRQYRSIFLDGQPEWEFKRAIPKLYSFIQEVCKLGHFLENDHSLLDHCVANLNDKILSAEKYAQVQEWNIMPVVSYSALFDYHPHLILRICELLIRHRNSSDPSIISDYMTSLVNKKYSSKNSYLNELSITRKQFLEKFGNFRTFLHINRHMCFKCIKTRNIFNEPDDYNTISQLQEIFVFANTYLEDNGRRLNKESQDAESEMVEEKRRTTTRNVERTIELRSKKKKPAAKPIEIAPRKKRRN